MNEEIQLEPLDPSTYEEEPGYEFKSMFIGSDLSYTVVIRFVDLTTIVPGINLHSYSKSDTLIKYSEARFSPVSSDPANCIQLATPSYYRKLEGGENLELIADDRESAYIESLNWNSFSNNPSGKITWARNNFWLYCASIDPNINYTRKKQMKHLSPSYNFMTKIKEPSEFAKQLGRDFGKQIELDRDLGCDSPGWHTILTKQSKSLGDYFVTVDHGPVIYLDDDKIERLFNDYSKQHWGSIVPFVKRKEYNKQREYRFLISVQSHSPNQNTFYLKVSDELKSLMVPEESLWH